MLASRDLCGRKAAPMSSGRECSVLTHVSGGAVGSFRAGSLRPALSHLRSRDSSRSQRWPAGKSLALCWAPGQVILCGERKGFCSSAKHTSHGQGRIERRLPGRFHSWVLSAPFSEVPFAPASWVTGFHVERAMGFFDLLLRRSYKGVLSKTRNGPLTWVLRTRIGSLHQPPEANC